MQEVGFLGVLLAPLAASLVQWVISCGRRYQWSYTSKKKIYWWKFLVLLHPLNNIKITNYFKNKPRLNGLFSRNNLPKTKDEACVKNLDDKSSVGRH